MWGAMIFAILRTAGGNELRLSRIGLGCVTFGREIDEGAAFAMMDAARERGITVFDTAAAYGGGASERVLGAWLASRRPAAGEVVVATKVLPPFTAEHIAASVRGSLERLERSSVEMLYLHRWDATAETAEAVMALDALVREGRVGAVGVSNFSAEQLGRFLRLQEELGAGRARVLQNNNNLAIREVDAEVRRLCAGAGMAIVTFSPLGAGFLTGKHRAGVAAGSRFELIPGHQGLYFQTEAERRLARLEAVAARTGRSQVELALAWALHQPQVATVLVGGRTPAHLEQAFAALELEAPEVLAELE